MRSALAVTGCDGRIYVFGGTDPNNQAVTSVFAYSPDTGAWSDAAPEPAGANMSAAARGLDGRIYVFGGMNGDPTVDIYTPASNSWSRAASLSIPRWAPCAAAGPDGRIYAIGGWSPGDQAGHGMEMYSPGTDSWAKASPLPTRQSQFGCVTAPDGRIYAIGGFGDTGWLRTVEVYDPRLDTWSAGPPLPYARANLSVASGADGSLYAVGGDALNVGQTANVQVYSPATGQWGAGPPLPAAGATIAVTTGGDGRIYAVGAGRAAPGHTPVEAFATLPATRPAPSPTAAPTPAGPDWRNMRYTLSCGGDAPRPFSVATVNGSGRVMDGATTYVISIIAIASGDLTGDAVSETAVMLSCSPQPSNFFETEVEVFDAGGQMLAELVLPPPAPGTTPPLGPLFDPSGFTIRDGLLVTTVKRYGPNDSHASGPSIRQTVTWRWNGHSFVTT